MNFDKIKAIIADNLSCDEEKITMEADLYKDLGADSLDAVQLNMAIEDEFGIAIADEDIPKIKTVADMISHIEAHKA